MGIRWQYVDCCPLELLHCCTTYEHPHISLSFCKNSFQAKKTCLLAGWLPACLAWGERRLPTVWQISFWPCPVSVVWPSCFCKLFQEYEWGKGALGEEWALWVNGSWQGCLQEYTIVYCRKSAGPMVAATPRSLLSEVFGNREGVWST